MSLAIDSVNTYEEFVQKNLCRLCWVRVKREIRMETEHITNDLLDKVLDCLGINLNETAVPNKICDYCIAKIESFYEYKTLCTAANEKLSIIIESHGHKKNISNNAIDYRKVFIKEEVHSLNGADSSHFENDQNVLEFWSTYIKKKKKESILSKERKIAEEKNESGDSVNQKKKKYVCKKSPTYCNICRIEQHTSDKFWQHRAEAHGIEDYGTKFKCYGCDKRFKVRRTRLGHEMNLCPNLKQGYKCRFCDKYLQNRKTLETHTRNHILNAKDTLPEFSCRLCKEPFSNKEELEEHKLSEHATEPPQYVCEHCGRVFRKQAYLRKHMLIHRGIKNYKCTECGHITRERSSLVIHMRKHTGERPYSCDLCDLKCISRSNLTAHRLRHLGVKKYECSLCSKRLGYKTSLDQHMISVHGFGEPTMKYSCSECGAKFTRNRGLKRHKEIMHMEEKQTELEEKQTELDGIHTELDGKQSELDGKQSELDGKHSESNASDDAEEDGDIALFI